MMKKLSYIAGAAALVMTVACQNEEMPQKNLELFASVEQQSDPSLTKSVLENGATVKWIAGDKIKVYNGTGAESTELTSSSSAASSTFTGSDLANPTVAIYPSSIATSSNGTNITFTLPATQNYAANSFGQNANVAVGQVSAGTISFKNVCGSLKLQLKGSMKVGKIEITSEKKLNGSFTVNATSSTPAAATESTSTDSEKKLTLDCGEGVQLDSDTATAFYFIVPTGALASGFTAVIFDKDTEKKDTIITTKDNSISRSKVKKMPACAVSILPSGYTELSYVRATGTQYINTGFTPKNDAKVEYIFYPEDNSFTKDKAYFGCYGMSSTQGRLFFCHKSSEKSECGFGCGTGVEGTNYFQFDLNPFNAKHTVIFSRNLLTIDGTVIRNTEAGDLSDNTVNFYIGKINGSSDKDNGTQKIYLCRLWNGTTIAKYFIPAKRNSDNVLGMYDVDGDKFYMNEGTGSFLSE